MRSEKNLIIGVLLSIILGNIALTVFMSSLLSKQSVQQLAALRREKESEIVNEQKGRVESAYCVIDHFASTIKDQEEAKRQSIAAVSSMRFEENNYVWVHRLDPADIHRAFMLVHPAVDLVDKDLTGWIDLDKIQSIYFKGRIYPKDDPMVSGIKPTEIFEEFNKTCLTSGSGVVPYYWPKIINGRATKAGYYKLSYVKYFPKWHWVIGAGAYADHIDRLVQESSEQITVADKALLWKFIMLVTALSGLVLFVVFYQIKISQRMQKKAELALLSAKDKAEEASRTKSQFLANMSHEIRTPMNGILGMTSLALETKLTDRQRSFLQVVQKSADHLMQILNDILEFSRIETGAVELRIEEFDLHDAVNEVIADMRVLAEEKGLQLSVAIGPDVPRTLVGDSNRLMQVIFNLIGNGIKFTESGHVDLVISLQGRPTPRQATLCFRIKDTGIGIAAEKHQMIFDSFVQVDGSTTRRYGGTGLGLSLSSQIVKLMGGSIGLESTPGKGSVFWFALTFEMPSEANAPTIAPLERDPSEAS